MKIHESAQGSAEWMLARAGIPTASEFGNLLTPLFKIRDGEMPETYFAEKVAERWIGGPLPGFSSWDTEQGKFKEDEVIPWLIFERGWPIEKVGLVTTDDGQVGCSPDGLIGEDNGLEVKCPAIATHVKYLMNGRLPKEYAAQVHGSMYVTGRPRWTFVSYARRMPPLILEVKRDEEIQDQIHEALKLFLARLDLAIKYLTELNGGFPAPSSIRNTTKEPVKFSWESDPNDIIP